MIKTGIAHIRAYTAQKQLQISAVILTVTVFLILFSASVFGKTITIDVDGVQTQVFVFSKTVNEVLKESNISFSQYDDISSPLQNQVSNGQTLYIKKAFSVNLSLNGEKKQVYTTKENVWEFLDSNKIEIAQYDELVPTKNSKLKPNMDIVINKATVCYETISQDIPYETVSMPNHSKNIGTSSVTSKGEAGVKEVTYVVVKRNNDIISKEISDEKVVKQPVNKITEYGTMVASVTSRSGTNLRYKDVINMNASAYDLSFASTGKSPGQSGYGITASGMRAKRGTVAVDPSVIPLGTKLYIESTDGSYVYGYAIAADKGGAIKGNKIDLFMDTNQECRSFGRRNVNVYILE